MSDFDKVIGLLQAGARAEGLRQKVIASNIANVHTPGYRRSDIRFEDVMSRAMDPDSNAADAEPEIYQPKKTTVKANGNDVSLDYEIGELVKNTIRHKTYLRLLSKKYAQMQQALETRSF